jgi:acyl-CoA synthetase (NDP forming)
MGIYCPEAGFSFGYDFPRETGRVGAMMQSGGSSVDIIKYGTLRGLKFSKVISYGNALDINEMDLLNYLAEDPATDVIMCFVEGIRGDGRDFLDLVRRTTQKKPFIICKGGRTQTGARCTMSHTASLAKASPVWETAIRQAGGIPVRDIDDLVQLAVAFSMLKPVRGYRLGTGGSGGGRNTVSADEWAENGFELTPLPDGIRQDFKQRGALLWDCMDNPADRSITIPGDPFTVPALLLEMAKHPDYDFICANVAAEDHPFHQETFAGWIAKNVEEYIELYKNSPKPFFLIFNDRPLGITEMELWFWQEVGRMRTSIVAAGVPFFPNVDTAARAIGEQIEYYKRR